MRYEEVDFTINDRLLGIFTHKNNIYTNFSLCLMGPPLISVEW